MDFFGIGAGEILLILILALIIWGPGKIPEIARTLGRTVRALRKASFDLTTAVTKEIEGDDHQTRENSRDKTRELSSDAGRTIGQHKDEPSQN